MRFNTYEASKLTFGFQQWNVKFSSSMNMSYSNRIL